MAMKNKFGYSMIKILSVLVIIGGIAGCAMAMNSEEVENEILDAASKTAILAMVANDGAGAEYTWSHSVVPCATKIQSTSEGVVSITFAEGCDDVKTNIETLAKGRTEGCTKEDGADLCIDFGR